MGHRDIGRMLLGKSYSLKESEDSSLLVWIKFDNKMKDLHCHENNNIYSKVQQGHNFSAKSQFL